VNRFPYDFRKRMDDFRNRQVFSFIEIQGLPNCLVLRRIQILAYWYSS